MPTEPFNKKWFSKKGALCLEKGCPEDTQESTSGVGPEFTRKTMAASVYHAAAFDYKKKGPALCVQAP